MLRKLTIENFYSISERQTVDFTIARNATDPDGRFAKPNSRSDARFPKVIAWYGANASGKTNVLRALSFLVDFARNSAAWLPDQKISLLQFFGKSAEGVPTTISVELDGGVPGWDERIVFNYEVEIAAGATHVLRETLAYYPRGRRRLLFDRRLHKIRAGVDFGLPKRDPVRQKLRKNASVISTLAQFNHTFATQIRESLGYVSSNVDFVFGKAELPVPTASKYYREVQAALDGLNREIENFDLGIKNVEIVRHDDGLEPEFHHHEFEIPMRLVFESQGTQRIYTTYPYIYAALSAGSIAILDEIDADIHPLALAEIIRRFHDPKTNKHNAQLIISCHNATLLHELVKEEIFFTEKDQIGRTKLYGLSDVAGVRRDENIYAKYLAGAYGAIPRLG